MVVMALVGAAPIAALVDNSIIVSDNNNVNQTNKASINQYSTNTASSDALLSVNNTSTAVQP
jgi:hypothetical protein